MPAVTGRGCTGRERERESFRAVLHYNKFAKPSIIQLTLYSGGIMGKQINHLCLLSPATAYPLSCHHQSQMSLCMYIVYINIKKGPKKWKKKSHYIKLKPTRPLKI